MVPLADRESKFYDDRRECPICKKEFCHDKNEENKFKLYQKLEIIVITQENLEEQLKVFAI